MKTFFYTKRHQLLLCLLIILQLSYITYVFCQREGWHIDEAWCYGFANGNHQVGIHIDKNSETINYQEWLDSKLFRDYIQVQKGDSFHFDTTYYNSTVNHYNPPLHNMLLHAVCSLFPDTFSWWYAYIINAFSFIIAILALYGVVCELLHSQKAALITCWFYGFSIAAVNTFIFLRMYAFLTATVLLLCYIHCKLYNKDFNHCKKWYFFLFITVFIGGFTQYIFLFFGFCIAFCFTLLLLCRKYWKPLLAYCGTMSGAAATVILLWPHDLTNFTKNNLYGTHMPYLWEVKYCLQTSFNETLGLWIYYPTPVRVAWIVIIAIYLFIIFAGIFFLLRKNNCFRKIIAKIKTSIGTYTKNLPSKFRNWNKLYLIFTFSWIGALLIIAKTCNIFVMGAHADRYLFCLYPILTILFICCIIKLLQIKWFRKIKEIMHIKNLLLVCFLSILLVINHTSYPSGYLFERHSDSPTIAETIKDSNVILVAKTAGNLPFYSPVFSETNQVFVTSVEENIDITIQKLNQLKDTKKAVYVLIEANNFLPENYVKDLSASENTYTLNNLYETLSCPYKVSEYVERLSTCSWANSCEFIQSESSFKGELQVYRLR